MKPKHALGLAAFAALAAVVFSSKAPASAPVAARPPGPPFGLHIEGGEIVLDAAGWGAWMAEAPEAVTEAIEGGAGGAAGVTVALMRRALPGHRWPPCEGDPGFAQWPLIVRAVAEAFNLENEPEPRRSSFRVVE